MSERDGYTITMVCGAWNPNPPEGMPWFGACDLEYGHDGDHNWRMLAARPFVENAGGDSTNE